MFTTLYLGTTQLRSATGEEGSGPCLTQGTAPSGAGLVPHANRHSHKITRILLSSQFPKFYIHFNPSLSTLPVRPSNCTAQISARHNTNFKAQKADVLLQSVRGSSVTRQTADGQYVTIWIFQEQGFPVITDVDIS